MLLFKNTLLINGTGRTSMENMDVLIEGERIAEVGRNIEAPENAVVVNLQGKSLLPGLIEAHLHMGGLTEISDLKNAAFGGRELTRDFSDLRESTLKHGVTTVRSCGDYLRDALRLRGEIESGKLAGPRIVTCGCSFQRRGGHPGFTVWRSDSATLREAAAFPETREEAEETVRMLADSGVDFIKIIMNSLNLSDPASARLPKIDIDIAEAITRAAHRQGMLVAAHCENAWDGLKLVRMGVDDIEHLFLPSYKNLDAENEGLCEELFTLMAKNGTYLTPTAYVSTIHDPTGGAGNDAVPIFGKAYGMGVKLSMGTDSGAPGVYHGSSLHGELEVMVREQGIPAAAVIKAATQINSQLVGKSDRIGTVEPGKLADLLIVSGNPVENISDIRNVEMVLRNGKIVVDNFMSQ